MPSENSSKNITAFIVFVIFSALVGFGGYYLNSTILGKRRVDDWKRNWVTVLYVVAALLLIFSIVIIMSKPPASPTSVVAVDGTNQATISFMGSGGTYKVLSSPDGITATGSASPIIITGLTNGTSYTFTVTASNMFGTSASSSPSNAVTPVPVPLTPTGVSAVPRNQSAIVSFTPNGTNATSFVVTSTPGNITATGSSSPITITRLTNGTSYTFTVKGVDDAGSSSESSPSSPVTPIAAPSAPTSLVATSGNATASIAFTPSVNAVSYTVTSSPAGITATGTASPIVVSGLTNGTSYTFTMTATNASGTSSASTASNAVTPMFPLATPTNIVATAGNASASIAFTTVSQATSYTVTSAPGGLTGTGSSTPVTVNGLTNGTSYTFVVRASNSSGTSANSVSSNSVTPSVPSTNIITNMYNYLPSYTSTGHSWTLKNISANPVNAQAWWGLAISGAPSSFVCPGAVATSTYGGNNGYLLPTIPSGASLTMSFNFQLGVFYQITWYGFGGANYLFNIGTDGKFSNINANPVSNIQNIFTITGA